MDEDLHCVFADDTVLTEEIVIPVDARSSSVSACSCCSPLAAARGEQEDPLIPRVRGGTRWGDEVVVRMGNHVVDIERGLMRPVEVPGLDEVRSVAGDRVRFAIGLKDGALVLMREAHGQWTRIPLPEGVRPQLGRSIELHACGDTVAIAWTTSSFYDSARLHWWTHGRWVAARTGEAMLVTPDDVWLGIDLGEWGGHIERQPHDAPSEIYTLTEDGIRGFARTRNGEIFVAASLAHMGMMSMYVGELVGDGRIEPRFAAGHGGHLMAMGRSLGEPPRLDRARLYRAFEAEHTQSWKLEPDTLEAIDVDDRGQLYVLTTRSGLFRCQDGALIRATGPWSMHLQFSNASLHVTRTAAVIIADEGVFIVDLHPEGAPRRVLHAD